MATAVIVGATGLAFMATGMRLSWDMPVLRGFNFKGGMALKPELLALWLAISNYTACFIAGIVRAGILAVSHGQAKAAHAMVDSLAASSPERLASPEFEDELTLMMYRYFAK